MNWCRGIVIATVSYVIGSVSFGATIAKAHGLNIFSTGSGSPGATNIKRTIGSNAGNLVFVLDFLKGFVPTWLIMNCFPTNGHINTKLAIISLLGLVLGHSFSIFHKFRGGKGVSVTMGGILSIMPSTLVIGGILWFVVFHSTRIVSLASLCFAASTLLTSYLFSYPKECILLALGINVIIFWRHKGNIVRMLKGTEYKFTSKN